MVFTLCIVEGSHLKASRKNRNLFSLSEGKRIHLFSLTQFSINLFSVRGKVGFLSSVKLWTWTSHHTVFLGISVGASLLFSSATVIWNIHRYICSAGYQVVLEYFQLGSSMAEPWQNQGGRIPARWGSVGWPARGKIVNVKNLCVLTCALHLHKGNGLQIV